MIRAAFIGLGSMGGMLVGGFIAAGGLAPSEIILSTRTKSKLAEAQAKWPGIHIAQTNVDAAAQAKYVFLCVKPFDIKAIAQEILPALRDDTHIVSIAGAASIANIEAATGCAVSKVIPTVASEVGGGVSLVCHSGRVLPQDAAFVEKLFGRISAVKLLSEQDFDIATELTSCMPGFIASIFHEVVESALRHSDSVRRADVEGMVVQTLLGTARLLAEKGMGFEETIERVATKGGITEEGVKVLRSGLPQVFDEMFDKTMEKRRVVTEKVNSLF